MKNKLLIITIALIGGLLLLFGYNSFFAPEGVEGEKEVALQIVIEKEDIDETFNIKTNGEFLVNLINENEEKLGVSLKDTDYGTMITGLMNYTADEDNKEFFHISINGQDAMNGIDEIPINNGDKYIIELKTW